MATKSQIIKFLRINPNPFAIGIMSFLVIMIYCITIEKDTCFNYPIVTIKEVDAEVTVPGKIIFSFLPTLLE